MAKTTTTATKKAPNTTVAIDAETTARLNSFCLKLDITKKDFISLSLDFFEQTGLTPHDANKVTSIQSIEKKMEAIDKRTEQSNTIISNVHGMVMGQVGESIKGMLEDMVREREATNQLLLEAQQERQQAEELKQQAEEAKAKKKHWWNKKK